jgi:hypothetical protein
MKFNYFKALAYLGEAAQLAGIMAALPAKPSPSDYFGAASASALLFDPALANDPNYQDAQKLFAAYKAAQAGAVGEVAYIPFSAEGVKMGMSINVGPAR